MWIETQYCVFSGNPDVVLIHALSTVAIVQKIGATFSCRSRDTTATKQLTIYSESAYLESVSWPHGRDSQNRTDAKRCVALSSFPLLLLLLLSFIQLSTATGR